MVSCPDENTFLRYLAGRLPEDRGAQLDLHLDSCVACRRALSSMALSLDSGLLAPALSEQPGRPATIAHSTELLDGRYILGEPLGQGGSGQVFAARHRRTGRPCAVKFLSDCAAADPEAVTRFAREARLLGELAHRSIISILDFAQTADGRPFLVMERLQGEDLAERLHRAGPMPWPTARRLFRQLCEALKVTHARGVLHRDIKPSNIFLTTDDDGSERAVLLDFGLAKKQTASEPTLTRTGAIMGTPIYMSPEQARGRSVDERTDVYSLAAVLYQMLTGLPPFDGSGFTNVLSQVLTEPPPELDPPAESGVPAHLDAVIRVAMAKDPGMRHGSVAELEHRVLHETPGAASIRGQPSEHKLPRWILPLGMAAAALMLGLVVLWLQNEGRSADGAAPSGAGSSSPLARDTAPRGALPGPMSDTRANLLSDRRGAGLGPTDPKAGLDPTTSDDSDASPNPGVMGKARPTPMRPPARRANRAPVRASRATPRRAPAAARGAGAGASATPGVAGGSSSANAPNAGPDPYVTIAGPGGRPIQRRLSQLSAARRALIRITVYMSRSDWKTCARIARQAPQTRMVLYYSIHCHHMLGDRARVRTLCNQLHRRFPSQWKRTFACKGM